MPDAWGIVLAIGLDLVLGDPQGWPHPVRGIGWAYARLDALADRLGWRTRVFGAVCVIAVAGASGFLVWRASRAFCLGPLLGLYFAYAGLALGDLFAQAQRAARFLDNGKLESARAVVAGLVSRDVTALDEDGLRRALAESVSENTNDGFVAPLVYLTLGGPGLLWAYKAVSTADSMWGYRTDRYRRIGAFGARADDVLAYVPARITACAMVAVGWIFGLVGPGMWGNITRDAAKSASPNAGWPMAAAAWICGASMGGPSRYFGAWVDKPRFGPAQEPWTIERQRILYRVILLSCIIISIGSIAICII